MKIKKLGHCCLVLAIGNKKVMTDPGSYTVAEQEEELNIDLIVITHEHQDHLHIDSLKKVIQKNPAAVVVSNSAVGKLLADYGIPHEILEEEGSIGEFAGVYLEAHGQEHAEIYGDFGRVQNTGYFIGKDFFYPGDSFTNPGKKVDILALPVLGPWLKIKDSIDYAIALKPRITLPVHDWNIKDPKFIKGIPPTFLKENSIEFKVLEIGKEEDL